MQNVNRVVLTGNLTSDPEQKQAGETSIARLRVAVNGRVKKNGEWTDKAHFFNVTAFGRQADNCCQYLSKGSAVAVDGRLDYQEWETDGQRRNAVQVVADTVQFLSSPGERTNAPAADDDIPF